MNKIVGFALFFIAVGMGIMMYIPSKFVGCIIIVGCVVIGYHLFCNCK